MHAGELGHGWRCRDYRFIYLVSWCCDVVAAQGRRAGGACAQLLRRVKHGMDGSLGATRAPLYGHGIFIHQWLWAQMRSLLQVAVGGDFVGWW